MNFQELPSTDEVGTTGIFQLKRIWAKAMFAKKGKQIDTLIPADAHDENIINILGLGIFPYYDFLFQEAKSFEEFEQYIIGINGGNISPALVQRCNDLITKPEAEAFYHDDAPVLNEADMKNWADNGYVIIRNAVSKEACEDIQTAVWNALGLRRDITDTWYLESPVLQGMYVHLYHHHALEVTRNSPKIKKAFEELWKRNDLILEIDGLGFNLPMVPDFKFTGGDLRWDVSLQTPVPFGTCGQLYITDIGENDGALQLVPCFHQLIDQWLESLPEDVNPRFINLHQYQIHKITGKAGDFIIMHHALPYSNLENHGGQPSMFQRINWVSPYKVKHEGWK
jgi:hypothetical protein